MTNVEFEPQKFFVGVVDFFAVLMPGALITYVAKDWVALNIFGQPRFELAGPEAWLIFVFTSYLAGHFAFLIGAAFADDWLYDSFRSLTDRGQIRRLAKGKSLQSRRWRAIARSGTWS